MGFLDIFASKDGREKHSVIDVIEYSGPHNVLVWKHDCENFNTGTQLIVQEGQTAIFMKDGVALETFPPNRYTLTTQNYPFIRTLVRSVTGGKSPFSCAVYYVNKTVSMGVTWGTDSPIRINDPVYHLPTNVTAYGDFSVYVQDEKKLLCELVGTGRSFTQEDITDFFSGLIAVKVRSLITSALVQNNLSLLGIDAHLDSISQLLLPQVQSIFAEYGVGVKHFIVANIGYTGLEAIERELHDQTRQNIQFSGKMQRDVSQRNFQIETQRMEGFAAAEVNSALGISEVQRKMLDVAGIQAANPGPVMGGSVVGLGGGVNVSPMQPTGAAATESLRIIAGMAPPPPVTLPGMNPPAQPRQEDAFKAQVEKLKMMRDADLLTEEEFNAQKQALLRQIMGGGGTNG